MIPETSNTPDSTRRYVTYYGQSESTALTTTLVHALADAMDIDVTDSEQVLYRSINPDALDELFKPQYNGIPRSNGHLTFIVHDYVVMISADGRIEITPVYK
ncbi:HalOD1 output domain-containing protein [Haladaptatus pallidirubidus]|uniref:Halobacterial output domain-containing protein n=1 Tax=Haladaptatus pallidirubidus TaxID=1008152 RepID=A0AAV3UHK6_9EURY|nr:HalOD1 output domain-containing protein [Haladaptatus pallidirubidus]